MDDEDEEFAHGANGTIIARVCKTARGRRIASHYEFATHMVKYLADRAKRDGLSNFIAIAGAPDDPRLPTKVDLVIMVDVFHHIANRNEYFHKLQTYLKPRGRIAIIDFNETSAMGPPISERIAPDKVKAEMNKAGYSLVKEHTFLPNQFYLVFQRTKQ